MRVVFMGTPEFAVPSLRALAGRHEIMLVVTRPDAIRGRGRKLIPSPVKAEAIRLGLHVLEASRATAEMVQAVNDARPDVVCVAAYGALLPDSILEGPRYGCINVHASLLPRGRGAAPIQRSMLEGDKRLGVSIMRLVQAMDAGPYCRQASIEVGEKSCPEVMDELAQIGANELLGALEDMEGDRLVWTEQDDARATYAAKIGKEEMLLDPSDGARLNCRRVRASLDGAPARAKVGSRGVRILEARVANDDVPKGSVKVDRQHVLLGCAEGSLELLRVKPDGKREMDASAWATGLRNNSIGWERA